MLKQECHKAEVLLGIRDRYSDGELFILRGPTWNFKEPFWKKTYTLIVDGKLISGKKGGILSEVATEYATILKEYGISDYALINGERIRFTNNERIKVSLMPQEDVDIFKKTLDAKLKR